MARRLRQPPERESGFGVEIGERGAPKNFRRRELQAFAFGSALLIEGFVDYRTNGVAGRELGNLAHEIQMRAFADGHISGIGERDAAEDVEKSGLARTVRTNDADPVSLGNGERDVLKKGDDAVAFGKSLGADDRWQVAIRLRRWTLPE